MKSWYFFWFLFLHDHFTGKKREVAGQVHSEDMVNSPQEIAEDVDGGTIPNPLYDDIEIEELVWLKSNFYCQIITLTKGAFS